MQNQKWFERSFDSSLSPSLYPSVLERLRGTPARLVDRTMHVHVEVLTRRAGEAWSIQENVGHLLDLAPLWLQRAQQLFDGEAELAPADLTNRRTHEAKHNARPPLLADFRVARTDWVRLLSQADEATIVRSALHPRLRTPMRLIDLGFFVAEHDDHHLVAISALLARWGVE